MKKKEKPGFFDKYLFIFTIVFVMGCIGFLFLPFLQVELENESVIILNLISYFAQNQLYDWSMIVTLVFLGIGAILALGKLINKEHYSIIASNMFLLIGVAFLALSKSFYENNPGISDVNIKIGLNLSLLFGVFAVISSFINAYKYNPIDVRNMVEDGMLIAVSFVLNLLTLFKAPTGGSINLQMLPLFLIALRHGPIHGLISGGIVYGLITCATDGYGLQCYPFDYLIGFGSVAVMGAFRKLIWSNNLNYNFKSLLFIFVGGLGTTLVRFVGSTMSSMILWETPFVGALIYNSVYVSVSGMMATVIIMLAYPFLARINKRFPPFSPYKD